MVEKLEKLTARAVLWGNQIDVYFELPDTLPENYDVIVFKRSETNVTDEEINEYFESDNSQEFRNSHRGLFVMDYLKRSGLFENTAKNKFYLQDFYCRNGIDHYYRAVVKNEDTGEVSDILSANATAESQLVVDIPPVKNIIVQAIKRVLQNQKGKDGVTVDLNEEIEIKKSFSQGDVKTDTIMIESVNGSIYQRFLGNQMAAYGQKIKKGMLLNDVYRCVFLTIRGEDVRDKLRQVLQAYSIVIERMIHLLGARDIINAEVIVEGDYSNASIHGADALGVTMLISTIIKNTVDVNQVIETIRIENPEVIDG